MAASYTVPVAGVYVASAGYMFGHAGVARKCIIESLNNIPTPDLETFINVMNQLRDKERIPVCHYLLTDINKTRISIVHVDRRWHAFRLAIRNDTTGVWDYTDMPPCQGEWTPGPQTAASVSTGSDLGHGGSLNQALVGIEFHIPFKVDGIAHQVHSGQGLIIDSKIGLIVTDRNAIPTFIGDVLITFANSIAIAGEIIYIHQIYNYAILKYDPTLLGNTCVKEAVLNASELNQNEEIVLVCMTKSQQPIVRKTVVTNIRQFFVPEPSPPAYRATNVEGVELENPVSSGGVIVKNGEVHALYLSYTKHMAKQRAEVVPHLI